jgi:hypothetical protein
MLADSALYRELLFMATGKRQQELEFDHLEFDPEAQVFSLSPASTASSFFLLSSSFVADPYHS